MSQRRLFAAAACASLALGAPAAHAGFPGNLTLGQTEAAVLRYVCSNAPQTRCVTVDSSSGLHDASECPANPAPTCVLDYVPNAEIRGLLTIIADDRTGDLVGNDNHPWNPLVDGEDTRTMVLLEFKIGSDSYALADFFPGQAKIGEWFSVPSEADIFQFQFGGGALLGGSLNTLGQKLEQLGQAHLGVPSTNTRPVLVEGLFESSANSFGTPKPRELETDQSAVPSNTSTGQPLASIARYRVTIKFVRTP